MPSRGKEMVDLKEGRRVAGVVTVTTLLVALLKAGVGVLSGSIALVADSVHTAADALAIFASWFGLKIATRKATHKFPYGFYKAETLATLLVSAIIIYAAVELFLEGLSKISVPPDISVPGIAMGVSLASALFAFFVARWERRIGMQINAQSLLANADESRADIFTSLLVLVAIGASYFLVPYVEGVLTLGLALLVFYAGVKNGRVALYGLMDASLDAKMEKRMSELIRTTEGVRGVDGLKVRRAGPFWFGEVSIEVGRTVDVTRGHQISHQVVDRLKESFPHVDSFTVHIEPFQSQRRTVMIPLEDQSGLSSHLANHFGRASYFAVVRLEGGDVLQTHVFINPFRNREIRAGLAVVNDFVEREGVDTLIVRELGEIGFHTLRDKYVEIYKALDGSGHENLAALTASQLTPLVAPTHRSDEKKHNP